MKIGSCTREKEIQEALGHGLWPQAVPEELRAHASDCKVCAERVRFTEGFRALRAVSMQSAPKLAPGLIWWRAQLRRRNEAIERIGRPLAAAQILAFLMLLAVAAGGSAYAFQLGRLRALGKIGEKISATFAGPYTVAWSGSLDPVWRWPLAAVALAVVLLFAATVFDFLSDRAADKH